MKPSVLFVSHTAQNARPFLDPSTRYRCFHPAASLSRLGYKTAVISQKHFEDNIDSYKKSDFYLFHRPMLTEQLGDFLLGDTARNRLVADFDDYIFGVEHSSLMPAHRFRGQDITRTANYLANNASASRLFSRFSLSTTPLAQKVKGLFSPQQVEVIHNSLDLAYQGVAKIIRQRMGGHKKSYRFGYFAGTATHDADLEYIAPAIVNALERDRDARMLILGPIELPYAFHKIGARIEHRPAVVPFHYLPSVMAQVETVVAPLEINEFTLCKSGLKFFEAAAVGCSVVATPIPDIARFSSPLLRKCTSLDDWFEALQNPFELSSESIEKEAVRVCALTDAETIAKAFEVKFLCN